MATLPALWVTHGDNGDQTFKGHISSDSKHGVASGMGTSLSGASIDLNVPPGTPYGSGTIVITYDDDSTDTQPINFVEVTPAGSPMWGGGA